MPRGAAGRISTALGSSGTIEAVVGDIVAEHVDAVVNAANSRLAQGAGVCGAIFRAAGARNLQQACDGLGGCDPGDAKATAGQRGAEYRLHVSEGEKLLAARRFADATREFEAALKLFPNSAEAKNDLQKAKSGKP